MPKPLPRPQLTLREMLEFLRWFIQFPALTLRVMIRRDVGYRLSNPFRLFVSACVLACVAVLVEPGHEQSRPILLLPFAVLSFVFGLIHRIRGWLRFNRGLQRHSYFIGISIFEFHWLPNFVLKNRRVPRYFDPILCALCGFALRAISPLLGDYIIFASGCLRIEEFFVFSRERNTVLDLVDSSIEATAYSQKAAAYAAENTQRPQQANNGIPSGLGEDIQTKIHSLKHHNPSLN